jgi:mono/diheme cytochrome c family protein
MLTPGASTRAHRSSTRVRRRPALARTVVACATLVVSFCFIGTLPRQAQSQSVGVKPLAAGTSQTNSGQEIYQQICQGCHMPDAKGAAGAGRYPALAGDPALLSTKFMAVTILEGRRNMPKFGGNGNDGLFFVSPTLDDEQIAAVINYVRSHFGNHFKGTITPAEVKALRQP